MKKIEIRKNKDYPDKFDLVVYDNESHTTGVVSGCKGDNNYYGVTGLTLDDLIDIKLYLVRQALKT